MRKSTTPKRIIDILKTHGFVLKRVRGSHHIFQHPLNKRRAIVPLHHKDLPIGTLREIIKQAGLNPKNF